MNMQPNITVGPCFLHQVMSQSWNRWFDSPILTSYLPSFFNALLIVFLLFLLNKNLFKIRHQKSPFYHVSYSKMNLWEHYAVTLIIVISVFDLLVKLIYYMSGPNYLEWCKKFPTPAFPVFFSILQKFVMWQLEICQVFEFMAVFLVLLYQKNMHNEEIFYLHNTININNTFDENQVPDQVKKNPHLKRDRWCYYSFWIQLTFMTILEIFNFFHCFKQLISGFQIDSANNIKIWPNIAHTSQFQFF